MSEKQTSNYVCKVFLVSNSQTVTLITSKISPNLSFVWNLVLYLNKDSYTYTQVIASKLETIVDFDPFTTPYK